MLFLCHKYIELTEKKSPFGLIKTLRITRKDKLLERFFYKEDIYCTNTLPLANHSLKHYCSTFNLSN